jgi:hypothetical protein
VVKKVWIVPFVAACGASSWTPRASGTTEDLVAVIHAGERDVAIGADVVVTSTDDVTWTTAAAGASLGGAIAASGTTFVASDDTGARLVSTDLAAWQATLGGNTVTSSLAASDAGTFVAAGHDRCTGFQGLDVSTDGTHWSLLTLADDSVPGTLRRIRWAGGRFVAVGDGGSVFSSPDGGTWTHVTVSAGQLVDVAFDGTRWIVVDATGALAASADLGTWSAAGTIGAAPAAIVWTGSSLVSVGALAFADVALGNALVVAVGAGGRVATAMP